MKSKILLQSLLVGLSIVLLPLLLIIIASTELGGIILSLLMILFLITCLGFGVIMVIKLLRL